MILLSGCSSFKVQEYNHQANSHIKKIGLIKPKPIEGLDVFYFNHPGMQFGLIGGLAAAAEFSNKTESYNKLLKDQQFDATQYYMERLQHHLQAAGYSTEVVNAPAITKAEFRKTFPASDVDAFVDCYFGALGYYAGSPSSVYKPTVRIPTHLVENKSNKILFSNIFNTGEAFGLNEEWIYLSVDQSYEYKDFDMLKAHANQSLDGVKKAIDAIAQALATSLKGEVHASL
jgi:hypothetical protein